MGMLPVVGQSLGFLQVLRSEISRIFYVFVLLGKGNPATPQKQSKGLVKNFLSLLRCVSIKSSYLLVIQK